MLIEQNTIYAYKLQHIENPTFNDVQRLARTFIKDLPQPMVNEIYDDLNRGVDQLTTEPQMLVYLHAFGNMHQAKLNCAFEQLPYAFLQQPEIRIVDYGCGQAIGTMCYADFLADRGLSQTIKSVTLIEPSEICLKRAALHVSQFFPDAEICTVCKPFDDLTDNDLANSADIPTLHILSNVLDIQAFDLEDFATLIDNNLNNYNQFVCVGPYFSYSDKDERMTEFAELLDGNVSFSKIFEKGELCDGKTWTAQIVCFSVGEIEDAKLSALATKEEIKNGLKDKYGVVYSHDGKRLLSCENWDLSHYHIKEGTKIICDDAFSGHPFLNSIFIPDTVTCIGNFAFSYCKYVSQIIIPDSIEIIGINPFVGCYQLNETKSKRFIIQNGLLIDTQSKALVSCFSDSSNITIPDIVSSINWFAFMNCKSLEKIIIPDTVTTIGENPFVGCNNLKDCVSKRFWIIDREYFIDTQEKKLISFFGKTDRVVVPETITHIEFGTFCWCDSLQQIFIPSSIKYINDGFIINCNSLQHLFIPEGCEERMKKMLPQNLWDKLCLTTEVTNKEIEVGIEDDFGVVYSRSGKRLLKCKNRSIKKYEIKKGTEVICDEAFLWCYPLQQITIPDSVISIGDRVFCCCDSLQQIAIPNSVISIGKTAFVGCESLQQITIPNSVTFIGDCAFERCKSLLDIVLPDSVTSIKWGTFTDCESLQHITIPNSITSINSYAFKHCKSLKQIIIPDSITSINSYAFKHCKSLKQITIPDSVTNIGNKAFDDCVSLEKINIPNSVTSIGIATFKKCSKLNIISESQRYIVKDDMLIDGKENCIISYFGHKTSVSIPNTISTIEDEAFCECESLQYITIPDSVTNIGRRAFMNCKSLREITIPNSVTNIMEESFVGCESLLRITIPESITKIHPSAFYDCDSLSTVNYNATDCIDMAYEPDDSFYCYHSCFYPCYNLNELIIGNSVKSLPIGAFAKCECIKTILIPESVTTIGEDAFYECYSINHIIIPEGRAKKFKKMLPEELWDKLYYLKKAE